MEISVECHIFVTQGLYACGFQPGDRTMHHATMITATRRTALVAALVATLAGCASAPSPMNLADTIAATPSLSTLNGLVAQAGLTDTLKTGGPFTVFAPTNDAFRAVPAKTMETLKDHAALKAVLTYHVLPAKAMAADVKNGKVKSVNGADLDLAKAGEFVTIGEGAIVTQSDIAATNGVMHIIDSVLIPPVKK
jgi:uncharacterized surface protein with fasciclin (FAS1) repeats